MVIDQDGVETQEITPTSLAYSPRWHPNGTKICYIGGPDLYTVNLENMAQKNLTDGMFVYMRSFHWSPDGSKIAFTVADNGTGAPNELWVMNADGSNKKSLNAHEMGEQLFIEHFKWLPNSSEIIYNRENFDTKRIQLWSTSIEGSSKKFLTEDPGELQTFDISPDGINIVYDINVFSLQTSEVFIFNIIYKRKK